MKRSMPWLALLALMLAPALAFAQARTFEVAPVHSHVGFSVCRRHEPPARRFTHHLSSGSSWHTVGTARKVPCVPRTQRQARSAAERACRT